MNRAHELCSCAPDNRPHLTIMIDHDKIYTVRNKICNIDTKLIFNNRDDQEYKQIPCAPVLFAQSCYVHFV